MLKQANVALLRLKTAVSMFFKNIFILSEANKPVKYKTSN